LCFVDDELKWTEHIDYILNKLLKYSNIFYKLRAKIPDKILLNVYYAFVHPCLLYAVKVYGNTCPTYIDKFSKLNNKLLRIMQHKVFRSHVPTCNYNQTSMHYLVLFFVKNSH